MNIINSIKGRLAGLQNDRKSRYWEYAQYYNDRILWEDAILFESFGGSNFQGNPYYIYKEIFCDSQYNGYRLFIAHQNPTQVTGWLMEQGLMDTRVTVVDKSGDQYKNVLAHAKYLVNNVSFNMDFIKKPGQVYLNTWHGTPLKCLGRNIRNDPFECNNAQRNFLLCDYLIAPNELTKGVYEDDYMIRDIMPGEVLLQGYPRNSVFYDGDARARIKEKYAMDGVTTILFMPTWRGTASGIDKVDQVSEIEQLAKDLGENYRVYVKFHPAMKKAGHDFAYCHNAPQDIEIYEFLNGVDILITDYSSVFFDFAGTGKKILLYQYDKEEYYRSRGVYDAVAESIPFPVAYTYEELLELVKECEPESYPAFIEKFCPCDSLNASKEAAQLLFKEKKESAAESVDLYVIDFSVSQEQLLAWKEKLDGTNYRFVFNLKRRARRFGEIKCWNQLSYMTLYQSDRLTWGERVKYNLCNIIYTCFRSKWAKRVMQGYSEREQRRLWGDMKISHIYAKSRRLPVAVKAFAEPWPQLQSGGRI